MRRKSLFFLVVSLLVAAASGPEAIERVTASIFDSAKSAVQLVIGLVGVMVFFLGLMRIAFDAGLRDAVARWLAPLMRRLFPEVPPEHPAMSAMVMNFAEKSEQLPLPTRQARSKSPVPQPASTLS